MITDPAATSAAPGVYTAVGVLLLKVPVPLVVHVAEDAAPPKDPAIVAVPPAQITNDDPADTVATGFIVNVIEAFTAPQGPAGSSVVYVNVTDPAAISAAPGVYTAVGVLLLKDPVPLVVHVAEVAPPPKEPAIVAVLPAQITNDEPADTVATGLTVTRTVPDFVTLQEGAD